MKNKRFDCFLIWGHGIKNKHEIIELLDNDCGVIIKIVKNVKTKNISSFVKKVYSFDYAPWRHLKAKTKYLKGKGSEVLFVFVENCKPDIDYAGEGKFRHLECNNIKRIKNEIRDKFNPRENGLLTHDHVIHATDNEMQTRQLLDLAGYDENVFSIKRNAIDLPWFIKESTQFIIRRVPVESLYCRQIVDHGDTIIVPVSSSVQYTFLSGNEESYEYYLNTNLGNGLESFYSVNKFKKLKNKFEYLGKGYESNYVLVRKENDKLIVVDGLHRASLCMFNKMDEILVCEL